MPDQTGKVVKKKVKPYPFNATIELNAVKTLVEVVFVSQNGAIIRLANQIVHVGKFYQVTFEIPVSREIISTQVRVLKTYDKLLDIRNKSVERLAELQFHDLTNQHRSRINAFTAAIGQESK